jgi:hypothetical protein
MIANNEEYDILIKILGVEKIKEILEQLPGWTFNTKRLKDYLFSIEVFQAFEDGKGSDDKLLKKIIMKLFSFSRKVYGDRKKKFEALKKK